MKYFFSILFFMSCMKRFSQNIFQNNKDLRCLFSPNLGHCYMLLFHFLGCCLIASFLGLEHLKPCQFIDLWANVLLHLRGYKGEPETGQFIKKTVLFGSRFCRLYKKNGISICFCWGPQKASTYGRRRKASHGERKEEWARRRRC